jgi:hypothetical protein
MEERSLKVLPAESTFINRISGTLSKLMLPTKIGLNSWLISIKRTNAIKAFEAMQKEDGSKKEQLTKHYDDTYSLYLEAIDKFIMDSIYKKVKSGTASTFERTALSRYYGIVQLKDSEYLEYKYQKQRFLLDVDYESIKNQEKDKFISRFEKLYIQKIDTLYKGILKHYSVKLQDGKLQSSGNVLDIYKKIFLTLEDYTRDILPIKFRVEGTEKYSKIVKEYEEFESFTVGKLDEKDFLEKNMILLGLSRSLFTHSLPLVAAEQCYSKLLRDTRNLILKIKNSEKREEAYQMLLKLVDDYNVKLLSTKVYWEDAEERESYKNFWSKYSNSNSSEVKEILSLKRELYDLRKEGPQYEPLRKFYRNKLIEYGQMRFLKNRCKTGSSKYYTKSK